MEVRFSLKSGEREMARAQRTAHRLDALGRHVSAAAVGMEEEGPWTGQAISCTVQDDQS